MTKIKAGSRIGEARRHPGVGRKLASFDYVGNQCLTLKGQREGAAHFQAVKWWSLGVEHVIIEAQIGGDAQEAFFLQAVMLYNRRLDHHIRLAGFHQCQTGGLGVHDGPVHADQTDGGGIAIVGIFGEG